MNMWKELCNHVIHINDVKNKEYSLRYKSHHNPELYKFYLHSFEEHKANNYSFFMKNVFIPDHQKEMILDLYTEVTLKYSRIRRCFFKYWFSKQKTCNSVDLSYTPFTEYKSSQYFHILDGRKKYLFTHTEMYNIIESSLTNSDNNLISNPLSIKNPYTGTILSKSTLYHIYFNLKHVPFFFIHYMRVHFDLITFLLEQEGSLRQYSIHKKVKNFTCEEIKNELKYMFIDIFPYILEIDINTDIIYLECKIAFSRELLTHYYNYSYSLNPYQRLCECKTLVNKIKNMSNKIHKNILT